MVPCPVRATLSTEPFTVTGAEKRSCIFPFAAVPLLHCAAARPFSVPVIARFPDGSIVPANLPSTATDTPIKCSPGGTIGETQPGLSFVGTRKSELRSEPASKLTKRPWAVPVDRLTSTLKYPAILGVSAQFMRLDTGRVKYSWTEKTLPSVGCEVAG